MGSSKAKIKPGYAHLTGNWEVPDFQNDIRLMRRLKRRRIANEMMLPNYCANAKRTNVGNCGNAVVKTSKNSGNVVEEEVDEDYNFFLDNVAFHIDVAGDNSISNYDIDVNTCHDSNSDDDTDPQYKMFLENLREDGNFYIFNVFADNQFFSVKYEGQGEERLRDSVNSEAQGDGDHLVCMPDRAITIKYGGSELEEKSSKVGQNLQVPHEATELPHTRQCSDDYRVDQEEERLHDSVNSEVECDCVDDDYQLFLNSSRIEGDNLVYMPERDISLKYGGSEFKEKSSKVKQHLKVPHEATELPDTRQSSDDHCVGLEEEKLHDLLNSEVHCDIIDEDYQFFLNSSRIEGDNLVCMLERSTALKYGGSESEEKSSKVRQNLQVPLEATELPDTRQSSDDRCVGLEEERLHDLVNSEVHCATVDEDYQLFLNSLRIEGDDLVCFVERSVALKYGGSESEEKSSKVRQNLQVPLEATELSNTRQSSDDNCVAKNRCISEVLRDNGDEDYLVFLNSVFRQNSEEKSSAVRQNLQISNLATEPTNSRQGSDAYLVAKHKCNSEALGDIMDEEYQLFLNSVSIVGGNLMYIPENGVTDVYEEECDQSFTDSEPVVLDPNQHCHNSPFICSKSYHSSCLVNERSRKNSLLSYAFDPYRKGLMEELKRPYDQEEYDILHQEASYQRAKERHREFRNGMIKSCPTDGEKESYLDMYSDLASAIDQVKEPHKVLLLLRGFFYWLKRVPQVGAFRPWRDASCLQMLQKL